MKAHISWCAMLICWIIMYQQSETNFNQYLNNFKKKYEEQFNIFKQIALGDISVSQQNTFLIINDSIKLFEKKQIKHLYREIKNDIKKIEHLFDTLDAYKKLDEHYLKNKDCRIDETLLYIED